MWNKAQLDELCVLGVVVVLLGFDSRVGHRFGLHVQSELGSGSSDQLGQLIHRELLGELVEDSEFAGLGWAGYC